MEYSQMAKTERRKHLRNRTTRIRTWECSSQSAVPYRLAIALNSGRETICSRIIFVKHPILLNYHACARYYVKISVVERIISIFRFPHTGYIHS